MEKFNMSSQYKKCEIDHHTTKLIVGIIALSLAIFVSILSGEPDIDSISESYHRTDIARNIFVGFLFAISAFLFSYNGYSPKESFLSKIAAVSALGIAVFPCDCNMGKETIPYIHYVSAAAMFIVLAYFCICFYRRARGKESSQSKIRAVIYAACALVIVISILLMVADSLLDEVLSENIPRFVFYCEASGLVAFGIAWLTASRMLPLLTASGERIGFRPGKNNNV
jgi:uncharacterized membrane protein (DUF441 family)